MNLLNTTRHKPSTHIPNALLFPFAAEGYTNVSTIVQVNPKYFEIVLNLWSFHRKPECCIEYISRLHVIIKILLLREIII